MKSIVIGLGETGRPLYNVMLRAGIECYGHDTGILNDGPPLLPFQADTMNICIPYSNNFVDIVVEYQKDLEPGLTIIHSTVPIGTTSLIPNAVHSPILGRHDNMEKSILAFTKWIGGKRAYEAKEYLECVGIKCKCVDTSEETEALKLLCLAKYGMSIAFANYCKSVAESVGFNYQDIIDWDIHYNAEVAPDKQRPLIYEPNGKISGHCVLPGTRLLNSQFPDAFLDRVLDYDSKDNRNYTVWQPANIYKSAKIGEGVSIGMFSEVGHNVTIGARTRVGEGCFIPEGVTIEEDCFIGPHTVFCNDAYPPSGKENWGKILVKKGARIGANVTVLPDVEIGEGALVGAGAVVSRNVPPGEIVKGVPAK